MTTPHLQEVGKEPEPLANVSGGGGGDGLDGRLARLETHIGYLATKEDIAELKVLIEGKETKLLRWLLGTIVTASIALIVAMVRGFFIN